MTTPPDGLAVERLAMLMAGSVGVVWAKLDANQAGSVRVMANAALLSGALPDAESAMLLLRAGLEDYVAAARAGADALEGQDDAEPIIKRLHRGATTLTALLATLSGDEGEDF